jgi:NitT/TauT family transport system substrate-binding protein
MSSRQTFVGLTAFVVGVVLSASSLSAAAAETKVVIATAPAPEMVAVFVAKDEGLFKKYGLDADVRVIQGGGAVPAAMVSNSIQIGALGTPNLLQANDSGLDFVIVAGGAVASRTDENYGIVARVDSGIVQPQDFAGKKVGLAGLEGFFHVLAREWLSKQGVDAKSVTFVEGNFPSLGDLLKARTVDAIVTTQPFLGRALANGAGGKVFYIAHDLPDGLPPFLYAATRKWAEANPEAAKAFKLAVADAISLAEAHPDAARATYGKYVKLPPDALATVKWNKMSADVSAQQVQLWIDMMTRQNMLKSRIDASSAFLR